MFARLGSSGRVRSIVIIVGGVTVLLGCWPVLTLAVWIITGQPASEAANLARELLGAIFDLGSCFALLVFVAYIIHSQSASGALLLDCGGLPVLQRWFSRVGGAALPIVMVYDQFSSHPEPFTFEVSSEIAFSLFLFFASFRRLQIRERGLLTYRNFIPWGKITSYNTIWHLYPNELNFQFEAGGQKTSLHIPSTKKQAALELFRQHRPLHSSENPEL